MAYVYMEVTRWGFHCVELPHVRATAAPLLFRCEEARLAATMIALRYIAFPCVAMRCLLSGDCCEDLIRAQMSLPPPSRGCMPAAAALPFERCLLRGLDLGADPGADVSLITIKGLYACSCCCVALPSER